MELRQLKYFITVAETLHFGKAARRLNMSQPPLSQQIRQLEEGLGAKLFERTSRSVRLTAEGHYFLAEARNILQRLDHAAETVGAMARGEEGRLNIGFVVVATQTRFPEAVREFGDTWPGVRLALKEMSTNQQLKELDQGDLDIGFVRWYGHNLSGFSSRIFLREPYVMALPEDHILADRDEIHLQDIKDVPLILFSREYQPILYDTILDIFAMAGVRPKKIQETFRRVTALALVAAGMGASPVPASTKLLGREGVVYKPIADPFPTVELAAVWPEHRTSPALDAFVHVMEKYRQVHPDVSDTVSSIVCP